MEKESTESKPPLEFLYSEEGEKSVGGFCISKLQGGGGGEGRCRGHFSKPETDKVDLRSMKKVKKKQLIEEYIV